MPRATSTRPARTYRTGAGTRTARGLALLADAAIVAWTLVRFASLPEAIPVHFGADGAADRMGERSTLLWMTLLMVAVVVLLAWLSTRPRQFNLPVELTPGNAQAVYREGERMMVCVLVAIVMIHLGIAMQMIGVGTGFPLLIAGMAACFLATPIALVRISRAADRTADAPDAEGGTGLRS